MSTPENCAWCLREQGIIPQTGSHGVCVPHAKMVRDQYYQRKRQATGSRVEQQDAIPSQEAEQILIEQPI